MEEKMVLPHKKCGEPSAVVSARLPKDTLEELDVVAAKTGRTRNEVISMSLEFSLKRMMLWFNLSAS